jgi:hypothetical protein
MCLPFLNLFVWYDALSRGWCVAYVGDVSVEGQVLLCVQQSQKTNVIPVLNYSINVP